MVSSQIGRKKAFEGTAVDVRGSQEQDVFGGAQASNSGGCRLGCQWTALAIDREVMDQKGIDRNLLAPRTLMASI